MEREGAGIVRDDAPDAWRQLIHGAVLELHLAPVGNLNRH
jgi:hypothetical protein